MALPTSAPPSAPTPAPIRAPSPARACEFEPINPPMAAPLPAPINAPVPAFVSQPAAAKPIDPINVQLHIFLIMFIFIMVVVSSANVRHALAVLVCYVRKYRLNILEQTSVHGRMYRPNRFGSSE